MVGISESKEHWNPTPRAVDWRLSAAGLGVARLRFKGALAVSEETPKKANSQADSER